MKRDLLRRFAGRRSRLLGAAMIVGLVFILVQPPAQGATWATGWLALGVAQAAPAAQDAVPAAVAAPLLQGPVQGAVTTGITAPPVGVPTLRWEAVPGATRYNVQISNSAGFAVPVIDVTTYATTYTPTDNSKLPDGTYYWRVRAEVNKKWGEFSEAWSFTKDWSAGGELKPILIAPADDPQQLMPIAAFGPEHFTWQPVPGAATYLFEISSSPTFSPVVYKATTLKPHHTPTKGLANNQYFWRVTPRDAGGYAGAASEVRAFTFAWDKAPTLLAPTPNVELRFLPQFSWTAVEGAAEYILEISTQSDFSTITSYRTHNTDYTPAAALSNNKDYYWRVKAVSPQGITGPASETWRFVALWVQPPQLLTPANNAIERTHPYFSWTPVAGAEKYRIQIDDDTGFDRPLADETLTNATAYTQPQWRELFFNKDYYWRVRAIDTRGNTTDWSSVYSFRFSPMPPPNLVYPLPYYTPDAEGMPVHTDRTIAWPVFVWDTTHHYLGGNGPTAFEYPDYYELAVATDSSFSNIVFSIETAGLAAAPTLAHPFNSPVDGATYVWRVIPMKNGAPMSATYVWWTTRIDRNTPQLPFAAGATPIHPADGFEAVGTAPVLGWLPVSGANHYAVQISRGPDFATATLVDQADALFPYYVPWQGRREPMPFGTYWWRVQARDGANQPIGEWSTPRRFNLSLDLVTGNPIDYKMPAGPATLLSSGTLYDPALSFVATSADTPGAPYELGDLHIIQDRSYDGNYHWAVAFGVSSAIAQPVHYGIYIDVNHQSGAGATGDPRGRPIATDPLYLPEYVIYIDRAIDNGLQGWLYRWSGGSWQPPVDLNFMGGQVWYDPAQSAVQFVLPYTTLVDPAANFTGSLAFTVFSTDPAAGDGVRDSVPDQGVALDNPAFVSDMLMPLYPFDTPLTNPFVFHEMPSMRWRMPYFDSVDGYEIQIARDADFTVVLESWSTFESQTSPYYAGLPSGFHPSIAYNDDESYYWRVRVRHERYISNNSSAFDHGPWSPPMRIKLTSYQVGNPHLLQGDLALTTPTFVWQRTEGASGYTIQVDNDANMSSPFINEKIDGTSFTPTDTLSDGTYYWRVAMRRSSNVIGQWSPTMSFTKRAAAPVPLGPSNGQIINGLPTFTWSPVISNTDGVEALRMSVPRYKLQWDDDPNFGSPGEVTTEATAYSLVDGQSLADGTWYWRVAALDGDNRLSAYSPTQSFYKEYLPPTSLHPEQGSTATPLYFEWAPLDGAASYKIQIADNEAFNGAKSATTDNTRYTPTDNLAPGAYYWRVQMVDEDGKSGPYFLGRFDTQPPAMTGPAVYIPLVQR